MQRSDTGPAVEQDGLGAALGLLQQWGFGSLHKGALAPGRVQQAVLAGQEGAAARQARQCSAGNRQPFLWEEKRLFQGKADCLST